jgi:hypothetical protein
MRKACLPCLPSACQEDGRQAQAGATAAQAGLLTLNTATASVNQTFLKNEPSLRNLLYSLLFLLVTKIQQESPRRPLPSPPPEGQGWVEG